MKAKKFAAAFLAASMLLALPACGKTETKEPAPTETLTPPAVQTAKPEKVTPSSAPTATPGVPQSEPTAAVSNDDSWKTEFEQNLFENYNVTPVKYESLGNGIYQVYVEKDGKVIPFVTVDSATGDYHG